ncbi:MAG: hypothetical protein ACREEB_10595 [Caulobacteraceae bacterium]
MPRATHHAKAESFNLRVDPQLKADFQAATEAADRPAAQVLRDFMRHYVERRRQRDFAVEARRQSRIIAEAAAWPESDEAAVMAWAEDVADTEGWSA